MSNINQKFFYDRVRAELFNGSLNSKQVLGLSAVLRYWETNHGKKDDRFLAYALATVHHETGRSFAPVGERGGDAYLRRMYDVEGDRPKLAKKNGNTNPGDGVKYAGRGFVQLTWKANYEKVGVRLKLDLVNHPELALELPHAVNILFEGMLTGWFTGKKLAQYFSPAREDWMNARRIINGLDKASLVKDYALRYYAAISYTI
jgi:putative chitinase